MAAIAAHAAVRCRNPRGWTWVHHALVVFLACAMPGGVGAFHGGLRHSLAGAAEHSLGAAGARVDMQTTRRTRQLPPTAMAAGREDRRAVLQSAAALSVLLGAAGPAGAIADFRRAVEAQWLPAIDRHRPQLILVSAGFDAHRLDPLAQLELSEDDFRWITQLIVASAKTHANGRIVSALEGGYDLGALAASAHAHIEELLAA